MNIFKMSDKGQSGRSMTEILGVLALMGILTMTALWGYQFALSKFRSNTLLDETRRRALEAVIQLEKNPDIELTNQPYGDLSELAYEVETINNPTTRSFEITYYGVPNAVCRRTIDMHWKEPIEILANGNSQNSYDPCGEDEEVSMTFIFGHNFGDATKCECGSDKDCKNRYGGTKRAYCDRASCLCMEEPRNNMKDRDNQTHPCSEKKPINVTGVEKNCEDCPNRVLFRGIGTTNEQYMYSYCVLPCPASKPLQDKNGNCYACDENRNVQTPNKGMCDVCADKPGPFGGHRQYRGFNNYCQFGCAPGYFFGTGGCYRCTETGAVGTSWYEYNGSSVGVSPQCRHTCNGSSADTPKRLVIGKGGNVTYCYLETCPPDKPLRNENGSCLPCSTTSVNQGNTQAFRDSCAACVDENGNRTHVLIGSICKKGTCPNGMELKEDGTCTCPDGYFTVDGQCRDCNDPRNPGSQKVNQEECKVCKGKRTWVALHGGASCLKTRTEDEFYSEVGTYPCDDPRVVSTYTHRPYCDACGGKRVATGALAYWCSLPCSEGEFKGEAGKCYPCDYAGTVDVKAENCDTYDSVGPTCFEQCPGQRYKPNGGKDCAKCPDGTYSAEPAAPNGTCSNGNGVRRTNGGTCIPCPADTSHLSKGACIACGRTWHAGFCDSCPANTYNKNGTCTECPEEWKDLPTEAYCKACGGAWDEDNNVCIDWAEY
ncbi:MAG: hypothetical protein IJV07_02665 [Alphaproteobacteria bacterium]|nr:hypothetical protein [Alphaproteobacteria bacterium]